MEESRLAQKDRELEIQKEIEASRDAELKELLNRVNTLLAELESEIEK